MKNRKRCTVFLMMLCLCFSAVFTTSCVLKSNGPSNSEGTWSDENVDGEGWT